MPAAWHEAVSYRPPAALQVSCENGVAFIDLPSTLIWFDAAGRHMESLESERPVGEQLLTIFHRAVTSLVRKIGDLEDMENGARQGRAQLLVSNSHAAQAAERLGLPLLRAGFPQYDWVGGYARTWVGYRGTRQALFDLANLFLGHHHDTPAYRSIYWADGPRSREHVGQAAVAAPGPGAHAH